MSLGLGFANETQGLQSRSRLRDSNRIQSRSWSRSQKLVSPYSGLLSILQDLYKLKFRLISYQVNLVARKVMDNYFTLMEVVFMKDEVWNYLD